MPSQWAGSTRRARLPHDWPAIRARILERDGHSCMWVDNGRRCGAPANQVDHVQRGDNHDDLNLRALCSWHHGHCDDDVLVVVTAGLTLTATGFVPCS